SAAVDVYALGAILYECLTGRPPFRAATAYDVILQVINDEPVPVRTLKPKTPRDLETICLKCLEKQPARRYASADRLADDLNNYLNDRPIQARPARTVERMWRWVARRPMQATVALCVVAVLALLGVVWGLFRERSRSALIESQHRELSELREKENQWS